jgi:DNA mismatch repair protein MutL
MRRTGEKWREEIVARSIARSFAGQPLVLDAERAGALVEDLASCRTPYVCPRGKPTMIFMSTRELNRKFSRD